MTQKNTTKIPWKSGTGKLPKGDPDCHANMQTVQQKSFPPFKATPPFKWKYLWFALGLELIVIAATGDMLTWWNTPRWVIMILRFISFTIILPFFAAYWAVMESRREE